jgi:DNA polymerase-3 subunit chi
MTEVLFYHLQNQPLEKVLPGLLLRCIERGWKVVVQAGSEERRDSIDSTLWTFSEESFLPHGTRKDGDPARQPIYLTTLEENPNDAAVRFLVDRASPPAIEGYARVVFLFDGGDPEALVEARTHWRTVTSAGLTATYWQQDDAGRWVKKG